MGNKSSNKEKGETVRLSGQLTQIPQGIITVRILDAVFKHNTSPVLKMDPMIKLKLTTQNQHTKTQTKGGVTPNFAEEFKFFVNSDSIGEGRILQLDVWDKGQTIDQQIGYGVTDLDKIIMNRLQDVHKKCHIVYNREPAGYVNTVISFKEQLKGVLFIHILNASIRRKIGVGDMNCIARITIGQAVQSTRPSKDTKDSMPTWEQTFRIPILKSTTEGKLQIFDHRMGTEKNVGQAQFFIKDFAAEAQQTYHETQIWHKQSDAGIVKFVVFYIDLENIEPQNRQSFLEERELQLRLRENQILTTQSQFLRSERRSSIRPQIPIEAITPPTTSFIRGHQLPRFSASRLHSEHSGFDQLPKQSSTITPKPAHWTSIEDTQEKSDQPSNQTSKQSMEDAQK